MKFLTRKNNSMGFSPLWCGGLPKWMKVNISNIAKYDCWVRTTVEFLTFKIWGTKVESPPKWYKRLKFLDSDSNKKALLSTPDMIDHCIVVFAVVVVLTCVMWWLQWLNTISIITQVIIKMHMLLLVKDYIMSCYNHHVQVIIARALNFKMAACILLNICVEVIKAIVEN